MSPLILSAVLGLAVIDMLSPAVIGVTLYLLLARPPRAGLLLGTYLATVAASYYALGVLLVFGLSAALATGDPVVLAWTQAGVGAALFIGSWFIPARSPENPGRPTRSPTVRSMLIFGLGTWLFEFYTAVPYFGAIGIMTSAELNPAQWLPLLAAYVFIMILPGIGLYMTWLLLGDRMQARFATWRDKIAGGSRSWISWIIGIVGALLVLDALPTLQETVF